MLIVYRRFYLSPPCLVCQSVVLKGSLLSSTEAASLGTHHSSLFFPFALFHYLSPMKTSETWRTIYGYAAALYKLRPWTYLLETDVFGIKSPVTDKKYFISLMGYDGTLHAMAAYEETTALGQFWDLQMNGSADSGEVLVIPHLIVSFGTEADTDPEQLKKLRQMETDFGFTEEWPEVKRVIPGHYPEDPDEAQLNELVIVLEQVIDVCTRAVEDPGFIHPGNMEEDIYLMREQAKQKDRKVWAGKYRKIAIRPLAYKVTWKRSDIDAIRTLPASQAVMQAHIQMMPLPVKEEGKPGIFPFIVLLTNKKSGRVEGYFLAVPDPDYETMLGSIPLIFLDYIKALGFRPRCIEVKSPLLHEMLEKPMEQCDIRLLKASTLATVEEAIEHFLEAMQKNK